MTTPGKSPYLNADGSINGPKYMAGLCGLSAEEISWTFDRLVQLMKVEGRSKEEAKRIVHDEAASKPWEQGA